MRNDDFAALSAYCSLGLGFDNLLAKPAEEAHETRSFREYPGLLVAGKRDAKLAASINPDAPRAQQGDQRTLLHRAVAEGASGIVRKLLENDFAGMKVLLEKAQDGATQRLTWQGESDEERHRLERLCALKDVTTLLGLSANLWTTAARAALCDEKKRPLKDTANAHRLTLQVLCELLPEKMAADINRADDGPPPLLEHLRCSADLKVVQFLLQQGADPFTQHEDGRNALFFAAELRKPEYLRLIMQLLGDDTVARLAKQPARLRGISNGNVLHHTMDLPTVQVFLSELEPAIIADLLVMRDADGRTPLASAVSKKQVEYTELLLDQVRKLGLDKILCWEDASGDTLEERVDRLFYQQIKADAGQDAVLPSPVKLVTRARETDREASSQIAATLDVKTLIRREAHQPRRMSEEQQASRLQWLLKQGVLPEEWSTRCQALVDRLPPAQDMPPASLSTSSLWRLREMVASATASARGHPRVPVPAVTLQAASKAKLDSRDYRYNKK